MELNLHSLEVRLEYYFRDRTLAEQALTHRSFDHEYGTAGTGNYQRLEFLGDAVLGMILAELLFQQHPGRDEGDLSRLRSRLADQDSLASIARGVGVGEFIRLGRGEEQTGGRDKDSILADVLEALIAAIYLDAGFERTQELILKLLGSRLDDSGRCLRLNDAKSELQELLSSRQLPAPRYLLTEESGPPHERLFTYQVLAGDELIGEGSGRSKKQAQQNAAARALETLTDPS